MSRAAASGAALPAALPAPAAAASPSTLGRHRVPSCTNLQVVDGATDLAASLWAECISKGGHAAAENWFSRHISALSETAATARGAHAAYLSRLLSMSGSGWFLESGLSVAGARPHAWRAGPGTLGLARCRQGMRAAGRTALRHPRGPADQCTHRWRLPFHVGDPQPAPPATCRHPGCGGGAAAVSCVRPGARRP